MLRSSPMSEALGEFMNRSLLCTRACFWQMPKKTFHYYLKTLHKFSLHIISYDSFLLSFHISPLFHSSLYNFLMLKLPFSQKHFSQNELCYFVVAKMVKLYNIDMLNRMLGNANVFERKASSALESYAEMN